jgi:hypothetical protein
MGITCKLSELLTLAIQSVGSQADRLKIDYPLLNTYAVVGNI